MSTSPADPTSSAFTLTNPSGLYDPAPNGYSHVAALEPGTRLVLVSGQGGEDETGALPPDFRTQVRQALANLVTALTAAGSDLRHVVKLTMLIVDHSEERLGVVGAEYGALRGDTMAPTCTLIPVPRLALDGMLFEIEAMAVAPASSEPQG